MRVLLAEDETRTRELIARAISSMDDIETVLQASNGEEAWNIIQKEEVDLLITDICMPKRSGLDLIKSIRESEISMEIIVMSGYNDFEYARTALKYNVLDYVLKPIDPAELKKLIEEVSFRISKKEYELHNVRASFFNKITDDTKETTAELLHEMEVINLPRNSNLYAISFITFENRNDIPWKNLRDNIKRINKEAEENINLYPFLYRGTTPAILFFFDNYTRANASETSKAILDEVCKQIGKMTTNRFAIIYSNPVTAIKMLADASKKASMLASIELDFNGNTIVYEENTASQDEVDAMCQDIDRYIEKLHTLHLQDRESIIRQVNHVMCMIRQLTLANSKLAREKAALYILTISGIVSEEDLRKEDQDMDYETEILSKTDRLVNVRDSSLEILLKINDIRENNNTPLSVRISKHIKHKIDDNIANVDFSIADAIEGLNYSENYIRYIFTNHEGMSIKEYIIQQRMEKAKELLNAGLQIKKIADMTGYNNQRYFARCFKDYTGKTPTEWRDEQ